MVEASVEKHGCVERRAKGKPLMARHANILRQDFMKEEVALLRNVRSIFVVNGSAVAASE
jgi:hypothetical protein